MRLCPSCEEDFSGPPWHELCRRCWLALRPSPSARLAQIPGQMSLLDDHLRVVVSDPPEAACMTA